MVIIMVSTLLTHSFFTWFTSTLLLTLWYTKPFFSITRIADSLMQFLGQRKNSLGNEVHPCGCQPLFTWTALFISLNAALVPWF